MECLRSGRCLHRKNYYRSCTVDQTEGRERKASLGVHGHLDDDLVYPRTGDSAYRYGESLFCTEAFE